MIDAEAEMLLGDSIDRGEYGGKAQQFLGILHRDEDVRIARARNAADARNNRHPRAD